MAKGFGQLVLTPKQERESKILSRSVLNYFQQLPDPRTGPRRDHNLVDIITIAILAVSSLPADAQRHNQVIRSHWSIENSLHWVLDVTFNEDASRIRQGYAAENLGLLRRLSVNLLKREPSRLSLKMKRYQAGINNDFLLKILAASAAQ